MTQQVSEELSVTEDLRVNGTMYAIRGSTHNRGLCVCSTSKAIELIPILKGLNICVWFWPCNTLSTHWGVTVTIRKLLVMFFQLDQCLATLPNILTWNSVFYHSTSFTTPLPLSLHSVHHSTSFTTPLCLTTPLRSSQNNIFWSDQKLCLAEHPVKLDMNAELWTVVHIYI